MNVGDFLKIFKELAKNMKKRDTTPMERLEYNRVRATIEELCEKHLHDSDSILKFESLPSAMDATLSVLEGKEFQEKYEFSQVSETCFLVRMRELDLL